METSNYQLIWQRRSAVYHRLAIPVAVGESRPCAGAPRTCAAFAHFAVTTDVREANPLDVHRRSAVIIQA